MSEGIFVFLYFFVGLLISVFFVFLLYSSIRERNSRAAAISLISVFLVIAAWLGYYSLLGSDRYLLLIPIILILIFVILFFAPIGKRKNLTTGAIDSRVDERDMLFAREEYYPGDGKYEIYYSMRPELKDIDDKLRKLPKLLQPGGRFYDPVRSRAIDDIFSVIEKLTTRVDGKISEKKNEINPENITSIIKEMILGIGADEVGVAELNPMFVYSHVGRGPEKWGSAITNNHRFVIAFTCEMNYSSVESAPALPITEETAAKYLKVARISIAVADYIRSLGYPARAHISGSNYQIMLPPVAHDAGLGELGRLGYLISPKFGARIRLGAVTTNLPLICDRPISFGVQDFCDKCKKCAVNCPSSAIPSGKTTGVRGVEKWPLFIERCLHYWRLIGTDCGLCMKVCPFSHPPTIVHNLIRYGIARSSFARTFSLWGDNLFYGKKVSREKITL